MNRNFLTILTLALATAAGSLAAADTTNSAPAKPAPVKADTKVDFQSFRLVTERNIFDMSRSGRVRTRPSTIRQVKVDDFTLIGTMSYEKGQFAFFDGSSSAFRRTLKVGDPIAAYKVTAIASDYIELQSPTNKPFKMSIGAEMSRRDNGPWSLGSRSEAIVVTTESSGAGADSAASSASNSEPKPAPPSGGGAEDDVVKRLMQKRAKEVKDDQ